MEAGEGQHESSAAPLLARLAEGPALDLPGQTVQGRFHYPKTTRIGFLIAVLVLSVDSEERGDGTGTLDGSQVQ